MRDYRWSLGRHGAGFVDVLFECGDWSSDVAGGEVEKGGDRQ